MTVCSGSEETLVLLRFFAHENVLTATLHYPRWASIRVEHSALMAQYVLGQRRQWNADTIQRALQPDRHVDLIHTIPLVIFYATATVDSEGSPALRQISTTETRSWSRS